MKKVVEFKDRTYLKAEKLEKEGRVINKQVSEILMPDGGVDTPEELLYYVLKTTRLVESLIEDLSAVASFPGFDKSEKEHFTYQVNGCLSRIASALHDAKATSNA